MSLPKYYRPISTEGFTPVIPDENVGPAIQMRWISVDKLFIDTRYQRPLNKGDKSNARQIARKFKWRRFAPVIVTQIPGTDCFSVIDGQYKSTGLLLRNLKTVPCAIVDAKTVEEQADSFKYLNAHVTKIMQFDIFKAALATGDRESVRTKEFADRCGIRIVTASTPRAKMEQGDTATYKSFVAHMKRYKEPVFVAAMTALAKNPSSRAQITSVTISSFCILLKTNPGWVSSPTVQKILSEVDLGPMLGEASQRSFKEGTERKTTMIALLREHILRHLDVGEENASE